MADAARVIDTDVPYASPAVIERVARMVETLTDAFFALDREWRLIYMNPVAHRMRTTTPWRELEGRSLWEAFPDLVGTRFETEYRRAVAERVSVHIEEYFEPIGRWFEAIAYPSDEGLAVFFRDVTERKQAELDLVERNRALAEAVDRERESLRRFRELEDMKRAFLTALSHELRTPLTAIVGFARTLNAHGALPHETRAELMDRLEAKAESLAGMVDDLLDVDRLTRGALQPRRRRTDLGAIALRVVEGMRSSDDHVIRTETTSVWVDVDPALVERIVENLVSNAIRHSPPETPVWVRVEPAEDGATIAVDDAGPGIPDEMKQRVFEPFETGVTAPGRSAGVGIGLALVSQFATLHGGRAWVADRPGGGCAFRVWLPASAPDGAP